MKPDLKVLDDLTFTPDEDKVLALSGEIILIKVGGNALTDEQVKMNIATQIGVINKLGGKPVIVHGGGIVIKNLLSEVGLQSEFIGGHRKTDVNSIRYIEMALSGAVNKELVRLLNSLRMKAVGISGKDGGLVTCKKRRHEQVKDGKSTMLDLGFVGDVEKVDTHLLVTLLNAGYLPVISPISAGPNGKDYNINADMFAGHIAGALTADRFIALTNINGLLQNIDDPTSIIHQLTVTEAKNLFGTVIKGGMIPKIEACTTALQNGVESTHIINGTNKEELLRMMLTTDKLGTTIR